MPWLTVAVVALALALHASPPAAALLVYERGAVAAGEAWRLLGAHWVHFSTSHLLASAGALGLLGVAVERRGGSLPALTVGAALAVGLAVHLLATQARVYAGLSGVACAAAGWLVVDLARGGPGERTVAVLVALGLALKLGAEATTGASALAVSPAGIAPLPLAHAAGAAWGVALGLERSFAAKGAEYREKLAGIGRRPDGAATSRR